MEQHIFLMAAKSSCKRFDSYWTHASSVSSSTIMKGERPCIFSVILLSATLCLVLCFLIDEFPHLLKARDRWQDTPLHTACKSKADIEVVRLLARKCPETLCIRNKNLQTPLILACHEYGRSCCRSTECNFFAVTNASTDCTPFFAC